MKTNGNRDLRIIKLYETTNIAFAKRLLELLTEARLPGRLTYTVTVRGAQQVVLVETSNRVLVEAQAVRDKLLASQAWCSL